MKKIKIFIPVLFIFCIFAFFIRGKIFDSSVNEADKNIRATALAAETSETESLFSDVDTKEWYADAVSYCYKNGLMSGTSETNFSPNTELSRAMLVTILHRAAGTPNVNGASEFEDVVSGEWYSSAVSWAVDNNIVSGYGNNMFGTNDPITREQLISILWRYGGSGESQSSPTFTDMNLVSSWALPAVAWGDEQKIVNIKDGNRFDPKGNAIRSEAAYMLYNYLTTSEKSIIEPYVASDSESSPTVYMTTDISPAGLINIYKELNWTPTGNVAVKITTGEPPASNYLKPELMKDLVSSVNGVLVECNTTYGGSRASTAMHRQVAEDHGYTAIAEVDIQDADGTYSLAVNGGKHLKEHIVGASFPNYDSYIVLSHFKGHAMAGYGGAIKNISIGLGSGEGKNWIHTGGNSLTSMWGGDQDSFLESMGDAGKAVADYLGNGERIVYINVMNRLSVDCDCNGHPTEPDMHDIGILASFDPVALDQACIDLVYSASDGQSLVNRIESRNGLLTLEHSEKIGLGSRKYNLRSIDK